MPLEQAILMVLERHPDLKLEGLDDRILQWCVCLLEAWFAADADEISLKNWDQEHVLTGGHGLMVDGHYSLIQALAQGTNLGVDSASPFQPTVVRFAAGFLSVQVFLQLGTTKLCTFSIAL